MSRILTIEHEGRPKSRALAIIDQSEVVDHSAEILKDLETLNLAFVMMEVQATPTFKTRFRASDRSKLAAGKIYSMQRGDEKLLEATKKALIRYQEAYQQLLCFNFNNYVAFDEAKANISAGVDEYVHLLNAFIESKQKSMTDIEALDIQEIKVRTALIRNFSRKLKTQYPESYQQRNFGTRNRLLSVFG